MRPRERQDGLPDGRRRHVLAVLLILAALLGAAPVQAHPPEAPAPGGRPSAGVLALAGSVSSPLATESAARSGYDWPVAGDDSAPEVLRGFDPPPQPWLAGHRGLDLTAGVGTVVRSAGPGTVAFAGMVAGRPVVSVQHPDGLRTTYEPVTPSVQAGDAVETGSILGRLSDTGSHCESACLHWGVRTGTDTYLDPLLLIGAEVVIRLYPPAQG